MTTPPTSRPHIAVCLARCETCQWATNPDDHPRQPHTWLEESDIAFDPDLSMPTTPEEWAALTSARPCNCPCTTGEPMTQPDAADRLVDAILTRPVREPNHGYSLDLGNEWKRATAVSNGRMPSTERDADRIADGQRMIRQKIAEAMRLLHDQGVTADEYADFLIAYKRAKEHG